MNRVGLVHLLRIALPGRTVRLSEGGFFTWQGEQYRGRDAEFGTIGQITAFAEGLGDAVPARVVTLHPPATTPAATLSQPGYQRAGARLWLAEYDADTGLVTGADLQFQGQVDQTVLNFGFRERSLAVTAVSLAERLFEGNIGNTMNPAFHQSLHPGERGHDNAVGLTVPVAWGVEAPRSGTGGARGAVEQVIRRVLGGR